MEAMRIDPIPSDKEILKFVNAISKPGFQAKMNEPAHRQDLLGRVKRVLAILLPFAPNVLEAGCAEGEMSEWIAEETLTLVGIDFNKAGIRACKARKIKNAEFKVMDLAELTPELGEFDLVLACDVLEHLRDPEAFIAVARQLGMGILATTPINEEPNPRAFSVDAAEHPVKNGDGSGHIWSFREDTFRALFEEVWWYEDNGVTALIVGR